jgi:hypothetical protein
MTPEFWTGVAVGLILAASASMAATLYLVHILKLAEIDEPTQAVDTFPPAIRQVGE